MMLTFIIPIKYTDCFTITFGINCNKIFAYCKRNTSEDLCLVLHDSYLTNEIYQNAKLNT